MVTAEQIDPNFTPVLREHVATVPVDDEALLYEEGQGTLHQLNPTAAVVCSLFDGSSTIATVVEDLATAFEEDPARIAADVLAMARELGRKGLLEGVSAEGDHLEGSGASV